VIEESGILYDQIALALHARLVAAGSPEDYECAHTIEGVSGCVEALRDLFAARDQLRRVMGGKPEFDAERFEALARKGADS
jgi:hypothetical protein